MFEPLEKLLILQERDTKLFKAQEDLKSVPAEAAKIKESLQGKLRELEAAKKAQLVAEAAVKQVELDIEVRKDTILKLKTRQGETRKNEEYQMLSHEIDRYGKEVDDLETKELELMEVVDEKKILRERANELFLQEKKLATEHSQALVEKQKVAKQKIQEVESGRAEAATKVEPESLALYERILKRRGVGAICLIMESNKCSGCNIKLPPAVMHRLMADEELVQCSECSRILYYA